MARLKWRTEAREILPPKLLANFINRWISRGSTQLLIAKHVREESDSADGIDGLAAHWPVFAYGKRISPLARPRDTDDR